MAESSLYAKISAEGMPGTIEGKFSELDLPEIYRLAQRSFGRDFVRLHVDGVVARSTFTESHIGRFLNELAVFYKLIPDSIDQAVQLNMTPEYNPGVKLKRKATKKR